MHVDKWSVYIRDRHKIIKVIKCYNLDSYSHHLHAKTKWFLNYDSHALEELKENKAMNNKET